MNVYGTVRPADITPSDVEIFVQYSASRDVVGDSELFKLNPSDVLFKTNNPNNPDPSKFELFGGLYTLKLPATQFKNKGIYNIIIKPVEIRTRIIDCGVLSAFPDKKGLVFDTSQIDNTQVNRFENGGLVGYRIEYITTDPNSNERKVSNFFTVVTTNNRVEPVNQNLTNSNQKAIRYRFNDNSSLVYATVTSSTASSIKPNAVPFIGEPNQEVIITNTFFNPISIEVEMVEHDFETLAYGILGNQTKSLEDGKYTIYNFDNEIYKQYDLFEIKNRFTGEPLYEVREERGTIDFSKQFNDITNV
jgi:hypothetical protein